MLPWFPSTHLQITLLFAALGEPGLAAAQTLYKSIDGSGRVVYSDQPPAAGSVEKKLDLKSLPMSVVPGVQVSPRTAAPAPPPTAPGDVVLYTATWCGYCKAAKSYLGGQRIPYREIDVDTPDGKRLFAQQGGHGVPLMLAQGQRVSGFTPASYDAALRPGRKP